VKTLILYRSFLGASKQYADWLHEAVSSDIMKFSQAGGRTLDAYDAVVLIGGTYGGWLSLSGYLRRKWKKLHVKRVVFVTVGGAPAENAASVKSYSKIPEDIRTAVKHFHLLGKFGTPDPAVKPTNASEYVKKENIAPIAEFLKSL
jgi:hypothetical protein